MGRQREKSRRLSREINEYGAKLVRDHPGRFGLFATITPADTDGSLKEIEHAFDTLKADGIGLLTSYNGKYLGDASFAPVYAELNRRKAVIYVHPLAPNCCGDVVPGIPPGSIEYATDSTRTIAHLVFSGTSQKYPDIRWIFSHSGGTLPFLTARFIQQQKVQKHPHLPNGPMPEFQKLYYELAQGNTKAQLPALFEMVKVSQVLYGTDYPLSRRRGGQRRHRQLEVQRRRSALDRERDGAEAPAPSRRRRDAIKTLSPPSGRGTKIAHHDRFAIVFQFAARFSAPRCDTAKIV